MAEVNWDDLRVFLTFVRTGDAYDAAQALSVDHTTVRRRIRSLEVALATKLLDGAGSSRKLTEGGKVLFSSLDEVEAKISDASNRVSGANQSEVGRVRVGAPDGFGGLFLSKRLPQLQVQHPGLQLELFTISRQFNIASREAEIAVVISYPPPSRHVIRKLGTANLRLYASTEYLSRKKVIHSAEDLKGHDFIGYLADHPFIPVDVSMQPEFQAFRDPAFASNSVIAQVSAAAAGAGIGLFPPYVVEGFDNLEPVLPQEVVVPIDFYLLVHADLRDIARFRVTSDFIISSVQQDASMFV